MCAGTPVHYEQKVRKEDAAKEDATSVCGYTGTLWANSHGARPCRRIVHGRVAVVARLVQFAARLYAAAQVEFESKI